jgi:hypothetical protein
MAKKNPIYLNVKDRYVIGQTSFCASSDRTIDISVDSLATNENLLQKLNLISDFANRENAVKFFRFYLTSFSSDSSSSYLSRNKIIRILILEEKLLQDIKKILVTCD